MLWPQCQDLSTLTDPVSVRPAPFEQVEHLLKLQKWSRKITSILDLDELIDHVVNDVSCAFGCVETNLYLHDEERGELEAAGVHGCMLHEKGSRLKVGKEGMVGYVAETLQMRYAPDVRKDPYYIACQDSTLSEVAIPLACGWEAGRRFFRLASRTRCLPARAVANAARRSATTWRWPCTMPGASSTNGTNASG